MAEKDYYKVLGVSESAGKDDVKKAFKRLAKEYHPDCNQGADCEDKFKEISEAYQTLSDPKKRKEYDLMRQYGSMGGAGGRSPGPGGGPYVYTSGGGVNFEDVFGGGGGGGGGIGDIFGDIFGGGRGGRRVDFGGGFGAGPFGAGYDIGPRPGRDVEADVTIGFDEAIRGGTHRFVMKRSGAGEETIAVKVPPGVNDGGRLRVPGKGEVGPNGGAGDLYLRIHVSPHKYFRRDGANLHLDLPVTVSEAALGAKVKVPTLTGKATLKVPAGTQSGSTLRLRGKGAPSPKGGKPGDLMVHVKVEVPKRPDAKTKKLLEELKELESDPRAGKF